MLPLDYQDLAREGKAPESSLDRSGERKYAVIVKFAKASVGKFDITDKESTLESIYALEHNDSIPDVIRKSAEYYVKQAAVTYDIPFNKNVSEAAHEIIVNDTISKSSDTDVVPVLKIAGAKFILSDEDSLKEAEEYFLATRNNIHPTDRINISKIILKAAFDSKHNPNEITGAYARETYGDKVAEELDKRTKFSNDDQYIGVIHKLAENYASMPVSEFLGLVQAADKVANVNVHKYGLDYFNFLVDKSKDISIAELRKRAMLNKPSLISELL